MEQALTSLRKNNASLRTLVEALEQHNMEIAIVSTSVKPTVKNKSVLAATNGVDKVAAIIENGSNAKTVLPMLTDTP